MKARWSTVRCKVMRLNPRSQASNSNIWVSWGLNSYSTKICCAGQTKLCLQDNFVAEDNSNYMKDIYDVELLQWLNKIIKDLFTVLSLWYLSNAWIHRWVVIRNYGRQLWNYPIYIYYIYNINIQLKCTLIPKKI